MPWLDVPTDPNEGSGPEGIFVFAGEVASVEEIDASSLGGYRVHVTPGEMPAACQLEVKVGADTPLRLGVDGERIDRFELYVGASGPVPLVVGDSICGLLARRLEPPFFTLTDAVIADRSGHLLVAASASGALEIQGWSFTPEGVATRAKVDGGRATWRKVRVRHGNAEVMIGAGPWPSLEADGHRYRVMATDYRKRGTLVPEEVRAYRTHAIIRE